MGWWLWGLGEVAAEVSREIYKAVGKMLKPIKADLTTIKDQLDGISAAIEDLTGRVEEIEKLLKSEIKVA